MKSGLSQELRFAGSLLRNSIPKWAILVIGLCSVLFFLLAADIKLHGPISKIDRPISEYFHTLTLRNSDCIKIGTDLAPLLIPRFVYALAALLIIIHRWQYLPLLWVTVIMGTQLNGRMQTYFARQRPRFADMAILKNPGFPSGHTAAAVLLFGFLILLAIAELKTREIKIIAITLATACILFVGFTRVALLVHHFTDVIGSLLWCSAWLIGCYYANIMAFRWSARSLEKWAYQPSRIKV